MGWRREERGRVEKEGGERRREVGMREGGRGWMERWRGRMMTSPTEKRMEKKKQYFMP